MRKRILAIGGGGGEELSAALRACGYACVHAASVREALSAAEDGYFALAVLDAAGSPDVIPLLRARGRFPILAIAPAGGRDRLIALLNAGADDYLTQPFELRELVERIEIQLRRFSKPRQLDALRYRELTLRPDTFEATLRGRAVRLTKQEFRILELMLLSPPGRVFSKQDFYDYAWDGDYLGIDKTINVHICNIRKKLREISEEAYIETVWGMGFRLV